MRILQYRIFVHHKGDESVREVPCDRLDEYIKSIEERGRRWGKKPTVELLRREKRWGSDVCYLRVAEPAHYAEEESDTAICVVDESGEPKACLFQNEDGDTYLAKGINQLKEAMRRNYKDSRIDGVKLVKLRELECDGPVPVADITWSRTSAPENCRIAKLHTVKEDIPEDELVRIGL